MIFSHSFPFGTGSQNARLLQALIYSPVNTQQLLHDPSLSFGSHVRRMKDVRDYLHTIGYTIVKKSIGNHCFEYRLSPTPEKVGWFQWLKELNQKGTDSVNKISFSHNYEKLEVLEFHNEIGTITRATLLEVIYVRLESLHKEFLDYDTDSGKYKLPKKGDYLLLIFKKTDRDIFTTLRRYTSEKAVYYKSKIGEVFSVEVSE